MLLDYKSLKNYFNQPNPVTLLKMLSEIVAALEQGRSSITFTRAESHTCMSILQELGYKVSYTRSTNSNNSSYHEYVLTVDLRSN